MRCRGRSAALVAGLQAEEACALVRVGHQVDHAHAHFEGHVHCRRGTALLHDQGAGVQVGEVKLEFVGAVSRVERCTGDATGTGHKASGHLRTVGQHNRHAVIAAYAQGIELLNGVCNQAAQGPKTQGSSARGRNCGGVLRASGQKIAQQKRHSKLRFG